MSKALFSDQFSKRHIGPNRGEVEEMLEAIKADSLAHLIDETVPAGIRMTEALNLPAAQSEFEYLSDLQQVASKNKLFKSYLGMGYYGTITPSVILRNIFQNPGWEWHRFIILTIWECIIYTRGPQAAVWKQDDNLPT